jgi:4,5-DOPA dioxygenase extradiol
MTRKEFLQNTLIASGMMTLSGLNSFACKLEEQETKMPVLFVGHGSPMNAIEDNIFSKGWREAAKNLPKPKAILCVSAHWETRGTFVTAMEKPRTIHDFGGFPKELFAVQYPAPGNVEVAKETARTIKKTIVDLDHEWGLDHGAWSIMKHFYPNADVPVLQLSLDRDKNAAWHYELGKEIAALRKKGVLIIGSGNMVHNLGRLNWQQPDAKYDWAENMNTTFKKLILEGNHQSLIDYKGLGNDAFFSIPTPEHYLPLLYILALQEKNEQLSFFNDHTVMGSISMTSVKIG